MLSADALSAFCHLTLTLALDWAHKFSFSFGDEEAKAWGISGICPQPQSQQTGEPGLKYKDLILLGFCLPVALLLMFVIL